MQGKKIILGVCGSIAAYKAALIVRLLVKGGAEVRVLTTRSATDFISPLTLATLSKHTVTTSVHDGQSWNNHVELGLWADAMVIAPATATTLGKLANGICDSAIVAVYLSARCPVFFAPAMDRDMWAHPATRRNVERLQSYGNHLIEPGVGELASGLSGAGRLAEPEAIVARLDAFLAGTQVRGTLTGDANVDGNEDRRVNPPATKDGPPALPARQTPAKKQPATTTTHERSEPPPPPPSPRSPGEGPGERRPMPGGKRNDLTGKRLLLTAGPTYEDLDPVRYLGNRSTGRMGIALAEAAARRGVRVDLVLGPTPLTCTAAGVDVRRVRSAREMHAVTVAAWPQADAAILAAAVADYRPDNVAEQKIKKGEKPLSIKLVRNPDIAAELGREKRPHQRLIGFALETENGLVNARRKLKRKHLDFIVLNSPNDAGAAFGHTTNKIQLVTGNKRVAFELKSKAEVAQDILDALAALW